ncbi:hypothetical protein PVK06_017432 [Gossypium arboreum]|uniref:Uncharacterized protein n=1 Tax=Gossypium arboreum TaxID=29729 RepID=A0ABR0Q3C7_GOSAR|nr:hypothetical protein PVK06_017432 [Gossypium arboreum]
MEEDDVIQLPSSSIGHSSLYDFYFVGCFATTSVIHFSTVHHTLENLWHPLEGIQITNFKVKRFLFRHLGHGNSFCPIRLTRDVTTDDMGWDISLRVVGRRAVIVDNIWLQKGTTDGSPKAVLLSTF